MLSDLEMDDNTQGTIKLFYCCVAHELITRATFVGGVVTKRGTFIRALDLNNLPVCGH